MVDGIISYITGVTGSGKTTLAKRLIEKRARVLVWDVEEEFCKLPGFVKATNSQELLHVLFKTQQSVKVGYIPPSESRQQFDFFCQCAKRWGEMASKSAIVVEETSEITGTGKAPSSWGTLCRRGRKRGIDIFSVCQRPQESDKTSLRQAKVIYCFEMSATDRTYMAKELDIDESELPVKQLEYIKKLRNSQSFIRKKLTF